MKKLFILLFILTLTSFSYAEDVRINGNLVVGTKGTISGLCPVYVDANTITLGSGYLEANGKSYDLSSATNFDIDVFDNGGFTYGYIDDGTAVAPTITLDWSATEPAWSDSLQGWYNGNDRCIISLYCDGAATIGGFTSVEIGNLVSINWAFGFQLASDMNPNSGWDTPDVAESSTKLPINAMAGYFFIFGNDSDGSIYVACDNYELASINTTPIGVPYWAQLYIVGDHGSVGASGKVMLGASRNVRLAGDNDSDNAMDLNITGYEYGR